MSDTEAKNAQIDAEAKTNAEAKAKADALAEATANAKRIEEERLSKVKELSEHITASKKAGTVDVDYYGFVIDNLKATQLKELPLDVSSASANIVLTAKDGKGQKNIPTEILVNGSNGALSSFDYYRNSPEEDQEIWYNAYGESVPLSGMPAPVKEYILKKKEEGVKIMLVKVGEIDAYGKEKRSTNLLVEDFNKRKENPELGNARLGCQIYDKKRNQFTYLGNLELMGMELQTIKIPSKKNSSVNVHVFYFVI